MWHRQFYLTMHTKLKLIVSPPAQYNMRVPAIPLSPPRYVASPILSYYACQTETNSVSSCTVQYACPSRSVIPSMVRSIADSILLCMPNRNQQRLLLHSTICSAIPPRYVALPILSYYACQTETNSVLAPSITILQLHFNLQSLLCFILCKWSSGWPPLFICIGYPLFCFDQICFFYYLQHM